MTSNIEYKFEIGKVYGIASICNSDCIYRYVIVKRTDKSVWVKEQDGQEVIRRKIGLSYDGKAETFAPHGNYSMHATIYADKDANGKSIRHDDIKHIEEVKAKYQKLNGMSKDAMFNLLLNIFDGVDQKILDNPYEPCLNDNKLAKVINLADYR